MRSTLGKRIIGKRYRFTRLEVPKVDLLKVFQINSGVVFIEGKKRFITYIV